jgi:hypothetical protein
MKNRLLFHEDSMPKVLVYGSNAYTFKSGSCPPVNKGGREKAEGKY